MSDKVKSVLIIEDEKTLLDMYKTKFETAGYDFFGAATGEIGINMAKKNQPDLILVDLILANKLEGGHIDGFNVLEQLKHFETTKEIPTYALTNLNQDSDIRRAVDIGADGFLVKSDITPKQLLENAELILSGKHVGLTVD
ncbi:MAG: response regulator [bacterium]|nr:response regulator [bacterium]